MKRSQLVIFTLLLLINSEKAICEDPIMYSGKTPEEKILSLRQIQSEAEERHDLEYRNKYYSFALKDSSPEVRGFAAFGLRGDSYIGQLIQVISNDSDPGVRREASGGLSHFLTDNGQKVTCHGLKDIVVNLDILLSSLHDGNTAKNIIDILGGRYSGENYIACCMDIDSRNKVVSALEGLKVSPPTAVSYWSPSIPEKALKNISQCSK